jgi:hypothetical protein
MPSGFPRAAFGLPIIFQFPGSPDDPSSELYPSGQKRMGSPFILRPLKAKDGQSAPMIVRLNAPEPDELELKNHSARFGKSYIVNPKFASYHNSPMHIRSNGGSAAEAFVAFLKEPYQGFKVVEL